MKALAEHASRQTSGRLPLGLAVAAAVLLLNGCSGHRPEVALTGGHQPVLLQHGADQPTRDRFWSGVKPMSNLAQAHYKLGRYYQKRGKHEDAIAQFSKAVETDPYFIPAYNGLGVSYDALGDCEEAGKAYGKALHLGPGLAYLHNNLGCSRLLCNDPEQALVHLGRAAELDTTLPRIRNNLLLAEVRYQQRFPEKQALAKGLSPVSPQLQAPTATEPASTTAERAVDVRPAPVDGDVSGAIAIRPLVSVVGKENDGSESALPERGRCPIEIINGNGVTGMAGQGADYLRRHGFTVGRIANASHFNHGRSRIVYRQTDRPLAQALAAILPGPQELELEQATGENERGIRLLLGRDMTAVHFSRPEERKERVVQQSTASPILVAELKRQK